MLGAMLKNILLHVRYPYTAGVIIVVWLGTAVLSVMDNDASLEGMLAANVVVTTMIALIGFSSSRR